MVTQSNLKMHISQREPQVIHETAEYVVIRNHPFGRSDGSALANGPRGVQTEDIVRPVGRGRGLQGGRGRASGRGAAILRIMQHFNMPVVGASPSNSREGSLEREMPVLESADRFVYEEEGKRNWG